MALLFQITLTSPQIELLKNFVAVTDGKREKWAGHEFRHFVVHVKPLLRENLITHETRVDRKGKAEHVWKVTDKGRYLLKVIEFEILDTMKGRAALGRAEEGHIWLAEKHEKEKGGAA